MDNCVARKGRSSVGNPGLETTEGEEQKKSIGRLGCDPSREHLVCHGTVNACHKKIKMENSMISNCDQC